MPVTYHRVITAPACGTGTGDAMTTQTAPAPAPPLLTTAQLCAELQVARSTLYKWWEKGAGPVRMTLPNGSSRVRREDLEAFLLSLEVAA